MNEVCCRLCMQEYPVMIPIFKKHRNCLVSDLINKIIPELILIKNDDGLSKLICQSCFNILSNAEDFRQTSIDNDRIQRALIDNEKGISVKVEDEYISHENDSEVKLDLKNLLTNDEQTTSTCKKRRARKIRDASNFYQCDACNDAFQTRARLEEHITSHSFFVHGKDHETLIDHRIKKHKMGFKCLKCKKCFDTKKELQFHNNIHLDFVKEMDNEEIEINYECILCAFKSSLESELYQHLPCHVNDFLPNAAGKLLVCNNCSTILSDYKSLETHVGVHNQILTHKCLKCLKKFPMGNRLLRHLMKHKMNEKVTCSYEGCNYKCSSKPQLRDHVRHKHLDEVVHLCSICGQSFGQQGSLRNHIKNIHDKSSHIYQCNMCPMTFRVPSHLRNHQAVHTTDFNFKCEHPGCTKLFRAKRNLQLHLRFHNRSQLNYKYSCEFCERKFLTRDAVKRHTYSHTKVKPFICNFIGCDRAFTQSNDLNKHLRSHYNQEETYFCSYKDCRQSFRLKSLLRYHEGIHYRNQDPASNEML